MHESAKSYTSPHNFKSVQAVRQSLEVQSTEMIKDFERQGHTASLDQSVTNTQRLILCTLRND